MFLPLLTAAALCGQIPDHSVGLGATAIANFGREGPLGGMTFEATLHVWNGVELYLRVPIHMATRKAGTPNAPIVGFDWATGSHGGARFLFLEGSVHPWVGAHVTNLNYFGAPNLRRITVFAGAGVSTGIDFALERVTFGVRSTWDVIIDVELRPGHDVRHHLGLGLTAALGF